MDVVELRRPPSSGDLETAREGDEAIPGLLVLRIEGTLSAVNIHEVQQQLLAQVWARRPPPAVVLFVDVRGTVATSVTVMDVVLVGPRSSADGARRSTSEKGARLPQTGRRRHDRDRDQESPPTRP